MAAVPFHVDVGLPGSPDDENLPDPERAPPTKADLIGLLEAVKDASLRMERVASRLMPVLWISAILLAVLVFRR